MRENEKSCDTCAHSYMERENFKLWQKCGSLEYNASTYTHEMFMEDWGLGYCRFWTPQNTERVNDLKDYFIGQGTSITAQFDTLSEMLAYHAAMPELDRHFCKLYDHRVHRYALGWAVTWSRHDKSNPWQDWN